MTLSVRLYKILAFSLVGFIKLEAFALNDYKKYTANLWELEITSKYFETSANYLKSGGTFDSLPNGGSYQLLNTDFSARWVYQKDWALFAGTSLGFATSKDSVQNRSNSQFNRILLGTDFVLFDRGFKLTPEVRVILPLAKTDKASDAVQTSEGATEFVGRLVSRFDWTRFHSQLNLGFDYRDEGRAALMTYGGGTEIDFKNWFLGGEIIGFITAQQDTSTSNPADRETTSFKVNGQSAIFNSVNPSQLGINLWYRYEKDQDSLALGGGSTLNGTNSAAGPQFFISWIHRFQKIFRSEPEAPPLKPIYERFKEENNDELNQELFDAPQPPPLAPDEPSPKKKAKTAAQQRQKLQNELQQTEMKMEIKLRKKKKQVNH